MEMQNNANKEILSLDGNEKIPFKKIFNSRRKPSERAKDKKLRQNRRLRRSLFPKNALMALNEVKGITISEFVCTLNDSGGFTATCTVNGKQHQGKGSSKNNAKNQASESALREYVLTKMKQRPRLAKKINSNNEQSECQNEAMDAAENDENSNAGSIAVEEDDELPLTNLASFALFKLFSEWERNGYIVPEMHSANENAINLAPKQPKKPPMRNELPNNWESMHPSTLLCIMRPGLNYSDYGGTGEKNNIMQRVGVIVDGKEFIENGRSKKLARRNVAVTVCNTLFGTNFSADEIA